MREVSEEVYPVSSASFVSSVCKVEGECLDGVSHEVAIENSPGRSPWYRVE